MKKQLLAGLIIGLFAATAAAQKLPKPALTPKPSTDAQSALIQAGAELHDQKKYDEAIALYDKVLAENPDNTAAIYEKSMSLYTKGELVRAMETAVGGAKYRSRELPMFYQIIASSVDDVGKPKEAIRIYEDAIKLMKGDKEMAPHLSNVHYNLAVTQIRQKQFGPARQQLKTATEYNNSYASPHYMLAELFNEGKYRVPAFAAAARLLSLEYNTQRTDRAAAIIRSTLSPSTKNEKTGDITIFLDLNAPKDEGDYGMYDLFLGTLTAARGEKDKNKSEDELFADGVDTVIALLEEDKKLRSTFVGKTYVPFLSEMKRRGYSKPFSYVVLYKTGNESAMKWLDANGQQLVEFIEWSKAYQPPAK